MQTGVNQQDRTPAIEIFSYSQKLSWVAAEGNTCHRLENHHWSNQIVDYKSYHRKCNNMRIDL